MRMSNYLTRLLASFVIFNGGCTHAWGIIEEAVLLAPLMISSVTEYGIIHQAYHL